MNLGLNLMSASGEAGTPVVPGTVPKVISSAIPATGDGIMVTFDRPMTMTSKLQDALSVIVNGKAPVHPDHVDISGSKKVIGLRFPLNFFKAGDVVTWAYNDQHPTEEIKGAETNGKEIDNQTYGVVNNIVVPPVNNDWVNGNNKVWTDGTNHWTSK